MDINIALLIVGIIFFATGALLTYRELQRIKAATSPAEAMVCRYIEDFVRSHDVDHHDTIVYYPVFRYCVGDKWYETKGSTATNKQPYAIGENVAILYDPDNPETIIIAGEKTNIIAFAACTVIGIGIIIAALKG